MSFPRMSPTARLITSAFGVLSLVPAAALAQADVVALAPAQPMEAVVVSATRSPQPRSAVLADVSVIERDEIERAGVLSIADLLARQPGVEFARNGGPANNTAVYVRGSENRQVAVYIDGIRVESQTSGGAMWEQIPVSQIERIELLRGPGAAVYGSDAVGGVVQIFTKRGAGPFQGTGALSVGSYHTRAAQAGFSGGEGAWSYALSAAGERSDGFNTRPIATANPDRDGWQRGTVNARVGWQPAPGHRIDATLLDTHLRAQYDPDKSFKDDVARHTLRTAGLAWQGRWSDSAESRVQLGESHLTYETQPSYYRTETTLRNLLLQHEQRVGAQRLSVAVERREDELDNAPTATAKALQGSRAQNALALGWRGDFGAHALQAHARHDDDSEFGGKTTGSLGYGWQLSPRWRAIASAGSSFRVPTLYQRFGPYGVATLEPESGHNVEAGLRWSEGADDLGATVWRNRVTNLINSASATTKGACANKTLCYENIGQARLEGVTLDGHTRVGAVSLRGSMQWQDPRRVDTDKQLIRRARRLATLGADTDWAGWRVGAELQAAAMRFNDADNKERLGGYGLLNLLASRTLAPGLELLARMDNVADKAYETSRTYATPGRTLQVALRWTQQ
jgi:vitamin B12 transporter